MAILEQPSPEQVIESNKLLTKILYEHDAHVAVTGTQKDRNQSCKFCIYNACHSVQRQDIDRESASSFLKAIPLEIINTAIQDVSTALGDFDMVKQFKGLVETIG